MDMNIFYEFSAFKGLVFFTLVVFIGNTVESKGHYGYVMTPMSQKICSNECKKWTPKLCWDGYLKRKVWKMVCEKNDITCCPGYEGPNCETVCFNCDRLNGFERRFIDVYGKIKTLEDTCTNRTVIINGSSNNGNTGDKITQNCSCPAGPRGDRGLPGPVGPPGAPGRQGFQGPQGSQGEPGLQGPPGRQGLDGLPGGRGPRGLIGLPGADGERGADGAPGLPGIQGRRGEKGEPGINGLQGPQGPAGTPGLPGSASAKGEPGLPGRNGRSGEPGQPGQKGDPGLDGPPGIPGQKGERGESGFQGSPGFPGRDGLPGPRGPKGEMGVRGAEGPAGRPGLDGAAGQKGAPGLPGSDGRPGDITKVEESRIIQEMQNTIQNLVTRLQTTTREVEELRVICQRIESCRFNCTADSFMCSCGMCIPKKFRCDGFPQCPDGSDEIESDCDYICSAAEFKCESSGLCIPLKDKCNGIVNCADGSDESSKYCTDTINCNEGNVPCRDGSKCVAREERCDGKEDCSDGSDEEGCVCRRDQFECASGEQCIPKASRCDNIEDCLDGSDESSAVCVREVVCPEGQLACNDKTACINQQQFCDGIKHCFDGSDEDEDTCKFPTTSEAPPPQPPSSSSTTTSSTTTQSTTTPSTTTTTIKSTTTTSTTTSSTTPQAEEIEEGSGDILDQETCKGLYNSWEDPDFPGGKPPPLSPDEDINQELCSHILSVARLTCETGGLPELKNSTLCVYYNNNVRSDFDVNTRQKRHKHEHTDDEEMLHMLRDEPARDIEVIEDFTDISFNEFDHEQIEESLRSPQSPVSPSSSSRPPSPTTTLSTTASSTPNTKLEPTAQEPDSIDEGSGVEHDIVLDQETCKALYNSWYDPDFSGGKPPPLSPNEKINKDLCDHILFVARKSCETGNNRVRVNTTLCEYINTNELPSMNTRQKRHKHHNGHLTDDEEILQIQKDETIRDVDFTEDIADIAFNDLELTGGDIHNVEIEPKPQAAYGSHSDILMYDPLIMFLAITCFSELMYMLN